MESRNLTILLSLLLISSTAFYIYKYRELQRDSIALQLKLKLVSPHKKKARSWVAFTKTQSNLENIKKDQKVQKDIKSIASPDLAKALQQALKTHWTLGKEQLEESLKGVDELILREPNLYSSYKGKLILLLNKESRFGEEVDEELLKETLEAMSEFDITSEQSLRKEAFLIARANSKTQELVSEIEKLQLQLSEATEQALIEVLELETAKKLEELDSVESELENSMLENSNYLNNDIIEIPLYRYLAKKNYARVIEESQNLLDEFPNSITGHFFIIRAYQLEGKDDEALDYIEGLNASVDLNELEERLEIERRQDPQDYWKNLRF